MGQAGHEMPDAPVHTGCVHAQQHLASPIAGRPTWPSRSTFSASP